MKPIKIISWKKDFIQGLAELLAQNDESDQQALGESLVIFPHNRPKRYLKDALRGHAAIPKPCLLPQTISFPDFTSMLAAELGMPSTRKASRLDQAGLLYGLANEIRSNGPSPLSRLPELDQERFFPWGLRLASLLEEFLRQGIEPPNLEYMEDQVTEQAAALLRHLEEFHAGYVAGLEDLGWATAGLESRFVAQRLDEVTNLLEGKRIIVAGFYALGATEDALLKRLWSEAGADVVWHSDPALALGENGHWAVREHRRWLDKWATRAVSTDDANDTSTTLIRFYEGFDLHSQISALEQELAQAPDLDRTAIVLPETGTLMPMLHHLPDMDVNISMGYPLERSALFQLLECILALQENRLEDGRYFWRDLITLIRHPYVKMLEIEGVQPLRRIFHQWETAIRQGGKFIDPFAWTPVYEELAEGEDSERTEILRLEILETCLNGFSAPSTLEQLSHSLGGLLSMLAARGGDLWHRHLVDAECLVRLMTRVVPELRRSSISLEQYPRPVLFSVLRQLCSQERVSFEPDPLTGLQILGMLETRLLRFKRVYVLDAVEEKLPGTRPYDPLFPDPMRRALGLPDAVERDNVAGYNFHRLIQGAKEAVILYQTGVQPGLLDSKSVRSRYVEQLIWEMEKKDKRLIKTGENPPVQAVTLPLGAMPPGMPAINKTEQVHRALEARLARPLSPSALNTYLRCPKKFFYQNLTRLKPVQEIDEQGDKAEFGTVVHEVLKNFLTPHVGQRVDISTLDPKPLELMFSQALEKSVFYPLMPFDERRALKQAGHKRLNAFMKSQGETEIIALEKEMTISIKTPDLPLALKGRFDRIDKRNGGILILDYKTGKVNKPQKGFWQDTDLFDRMDKCDPQAESDPKLLSDIAIRGQDLQLPLYAFLYYRSQSVLPGNACWIELAKNGEEVPLFPDNWTEQELAEALDETVLQLLQFLAGHMLNSPRFVPAPGRYCQWCDFKGPCGA